MAIRHQLIDRDPAAVWTVLSNPARYADWVVGTSDSAPRSGSWPDVGSSLSFTVTLGKRRAQGHTVVRRFEPPRHLELEAHTPLGSARIALDIRTWGDETLVILDEHPLRGLGGRPPQHGSRRAAPTAAPPDAAPPRARGRTGAPRDAGDPPGRPGG